MEDFRLGSVPPLDAAYDQEHGSRRDKKDKRRQPSPEQSEDVVDLHAQPDPAEDEPSYGPGSHPPRG